MERRDELQDCSTISSPEAGENFRGARNAFHREVLVRTLADTSGVALSRSVQNALLADLNSERDGEAAAFTFHRIDNVSVEARLGGRKIGRLIECDDGSCVGDEEPTA